jgi:hypothetical protein
MKSVKWIILVIMLFEFTSMIWAEENCAACQKASEGGCGVTSTQVASKETVNIITLPGYGKKVWINKNTYFTYSFISKVKMGANTLKVNMYDMNKKPITSYQVLVSYDMPSMKGMHANKDKPMLINKKGIYLLPLNFVMPGVWQVDLQFMMDKKTAAKGTFTLKI